MRKIFFLLVVFSSLPGCDSTRVYEQFQTLDGTWAVGETVGFDFEVKEVNTSHKMKAHFKYDMAFEYHNFYYQTSLIDSRDSILFTQLEEVIFFDPKTGEPVGGGIGGSFDISHTFKTDFQFSERGSYRMEFQQFMRVDTLRHLLKAGFRLENNAI